MAPSWIYVVFAKDPLGRTLQFFLYSLISLALVRKAYVSRSWVMTRLHLTYFYVDVVYKFVLQAADTALGVLIPLGVVQLVFVKTGFAGPELRNFHPAIQIFAVLMVVDFAVYVFHYLQHKYMWDFHKLHHSPKVVDWLIAEASHPLIKALTYCLEGTIFAALRVDRDAVLTSMWIRALFGNIQHIDCGIGFPGILRYVFVSPLMHRYHHTWEGGRSNLSTVFAFWDVFFGTYRMPAPGSDSPLGIEDPDYPKDFWGQIWYPFRKIFRK